VHDIDDEYRVAMKDPLGPKWSMQDDDGELIDDETRHGGDPRAAKDSYEAGMAKAFDRCSDAMRDDGRMVVVFANKAPEAWESLAASVIRAGFIVDGSWPIQTEQPSRMRGLSSAALASSVWLVCRKRSATAKPGWDNKVLDEMRANIKQRL